MTPSVFILSSGEPTLGRGKFKESPASPGLLLTMCLVPVLLEVYSPLQEKKQLNHIVMFYAESRWAPDEIMPFEREALPRVLDRWPTLRDLSSCESGIPVTDPPLPDHVEETYEHGDDLWNETEELEMELDVHDYVEVEQWPDLPSSEIAQDD